MNQLESSGAVLVGIGCVGWAIATTREFTTGVIPSVALLVVGLGVVLYGRYG